MGLASGIAGAVWNAAKSTGRDYVSYVKRAKDLTMNSVRSNLPINKAEDAVETAASVGKKSRKRAKQKAAGRARKNPGVHNSVDNPAPQDSWKQLGLDAFGNGQNVTLGKAAGTTAVAGLTLYAGGSVASRGLHAAFHDNDGKFDVVGIPIV